MSFQGHWLGEWLGRWLGSITGGGNLSASIGGSGSISATLTFTAAPVVDDSYPFSADDARRPTIEEEELFEMAMALITSGALEGT